MKYLATSWVWIHHNMKRNKMFQLKVSLKKLHWNFVTIVRLLIMTAQMCYYQMHGDSPNAITTNITSHKPLNDLFNHKSPLQSEDRRQIFWLIVTTAKMLACYRHCLVGCSSCHSSNLYTSQTASSEVQDNEVNGVTCTHTCTHMYKGTHTHTHTCTHVRVHTHMHACARTHTYTHTNTHTHSNLCIDY